MSDRGVQSVPVFVADELPVREMLGLGGEPARPCRVKIAIRGEQVGDPDRRLATVRHDAGGDPSAEVASEDHDCRVGEEFRPEQAGGHVTVAPCGLPGQQRIRIADRPPVNALWW